MYPMTVIFGRQILDEEDECSSLIMESAIRKRICDTNRDRNLLSFLFPDEFNRRLVYPRLIRRLREEKNERERNEWKFHR